MRTSIYLCSLVCVLAYGHPAFAYNVFYCDDSNIPMHNLADEQTLLVAPDVSSSDWESQIETAFALFNQSVSPMIVLMASDNNGAAVANMESELFWDDTTPAPCTTKQYDCATHAIVEADLRLPSSARDNYVSSDNKHDIDWYAGANDIASHQVGNYITSAVLHELGHVAGMLHTTDQYSLMGDSRKFMHANGAQLSAYLGTDANAGLNYLYGAGPATTDVSVSHWKYDPTARVGDDYAEHRRVQVFDAQGSLVGSQYGVNGTEDSDQYQLVRGATYNFEFTFENNGIAEQTFDTDLYLSGDDTIDSSDQWLRRISGTSSGLDRTTNSWITLTMPTDAQVGPNYYIGAIVDPDGVLEEQDEFNATYVPVVFVE
jgi:hypothetical protein